MNDTPKNPDLSDQAGPRATAPRAKPSGRGDDTRLALLKAGRDTFARRGFDGASVREITRAAGANLGAVTYHFGSKRALYTAVLLEGLTPMVERVAQAASEEGIAAERLGRVVEVFFDHISANPDLPRLMLQELTAGKRPPPELVALMQRNLGNIGAILAQGAQDGSIRQGHPVLTALSVLAQPIYMSVMTPMLREVAGLDLAAPTFRAEAREHMKRFVQAGLAAEQENEA